METQKAFQVAKREWANIRDSLEMCGDIEEYSSKKYIKNHIKSGFTFVSGGPHLVRNLIEMENKFPAHGYFTPEAAGVFADLASRAAERLGLLSKFARAFGRGYIVILNRMCKVIVSLMRAMSLSQKKNLSFPQSLSGNPLL